MCCDCSESFDHWPGAHRPWTLMIVPPEDGRKRRKSLMPKHAEIPVDHTAFPILGKITDHQITLNEKRERSNLGNYKENPKYKRRPKKQVI